MKSISKRCRRLSTRATCRQRVRISRLPGNIPNAAGVGTTFQSLPQQSVCDTDYAQSLTPGSLQVALADGSVRTIDQSISPLTWRNALLPDDGQALGSDW